MADKENIYGVKYEVDISELKTSTQEAGRQIKLANAEFKKSTSGMDNWAKSADGVSAKIKQLNATLEAEKAKLLQLQVSYNKSIDAINSYDAQISELKAKKEEAIKQYGEESEEVEKLNKEITKLERKQQSSVATAEKLNIAIVEQEAKINGTTKEVDKYSAKLGELQAQENKTVSATDKLKDAIGKQETELAGLKKEYANIVLEQGKTSDEAKNLASRIRELNGDLNKNKSDLSQAKREADNLTESLKDTGDGADKASEGFTVMKGALANVVGNVVTAGISKIGELTGALFELSDATEEYRTMSAKLEGSADTFGYSIDFAKEKYKEFYGYLKDEQMATNAITNLMGLGASTETVNSIVNSSIGVWSAYGDSIPIEALTESINETAQVGKVTGSLADALNWAGISEDKFNEKLKKTNGTKERAQLIADTLNAKYGDSKKKYDELTGSMTEANRAELELKETQAELGETIEPVNTAFKNFKTKALDFIAPGIEFLAGKFLELTGYLQEHPAVMNAVIAVVIALASAFGVLAVALGISAIISGVTKAIALLNTTMLANPITLIIALITGLVAGFIYLWNTSEGFRNFWIGLWDSIVSATQLVVTAIVTFFTVTIPTALSTFSQGVSNVVTSVSQFFQNLWTNIVSFFTATIPAWIANAIAFFQQLPNYIGYMIGFIIGKFISWGQNLVKFATSDIPNFISKTLAFFGRLPGEIWNFLSNVISRTGTWVSNMASKATQAGSQFISNVVNYFTQLPGRIWTFLSNAISRVASFASELASKGREAGSKLMSNIVSTLQSLPSKMASIGKNVVQGLWNGINGMISWVVGKVKGFGSAVMSGIKSALGINSPSKITYYFGEMLDLGLGNAIEDGTGKVVGKARTMSSKVLGAMKDKLKEKVDVGLNVADNIKTGVRGAIGRIAYGGNDGQLAYAGATTNINNITMNQNNYSPKSLDSLQIYRNTRKQLKQLEKWKGKK